MPSSSTTGAGASPRESTQITAPSTTYPSAIIKVVRVISSWVPWMKPIAESMAPAAQ
ncbi:hypothetical protein D3C83_311170 [compost metagenome]